MTLIKRNDNFPMWTNIINDIFNHDWNDLSLRNYSLTNTTLPSVNIKENDESFDLEMAAPGMVKEDFKVEVNQGILSVSSEKRVENQEAESDRYTRREFSYQAFCRSFSLPSSVDSDKIMAKYENGILKVHIPKKEEAKPKPVRLIDIE
ncbi:Spore protein SP21 [bioreactor metagenome]|uniref:Spore protein SP21 n=1 Tax=bioreactor metagenome TaxID=1076179 RepID=A0A644XEV1_9ZZZZ|nr:Hsp20/alpha crystallin family protein [Rikenellaceae bacterium]